MAQSDLDWTIHLMHAGYAGRGLAYLSVAGVSLWTIWQGGSASGPSEVFSDLSRSTLGDLLLGLIAVGMLAYCVWRLVCAVFDLEDHGNSPKGIIARVAQGVTGLLHLLIGAVAVIAAVSVDESDDGGGSIDEVVSAVLSAPLGRYAVMAAGAITICAGLYYFYKAVSRSYQDHLESNPVTQHLNYVLEAGIAAQGIVISIIGGLLCLAGWRAQAQQAGGLGKVFDTLSSQLYGQIFVTGLCIGLLAFALFCFVNAAYRSVPKLSHGNIETLGAWAKAQTS